MTPTRDPKQGICLRLEAKRRCQDLEARIWQPRCGSQDLVARIWKPRCGSQDLVARIWKARMWQPGCGSQDLVGRIWKPKSGSENDEQKLCLYEKLDLG